MDVVCVCAGVVIADVASEYITGYWRKGRSFREHATQSNEAFQETNDLGVKVGSVTRGNEGGVGIFVG